MHFYRSKIVLFITYSNSIFVKLHGKFPEISGNSEIQENSGKCRRVFSGKITGNFPQDFPVFLRDENTVTALILFFKKLKIKEISVNFGRQFSRNSGKAFPENVEKFSPNFSAFF